MSQANNEILKLLNGPIEPLQYMLFKLGLEELDHGRYFVDRCVACQTIKIRDDTHCHRWCDGRCNKFMCANCVMSGCEDIRIIDENDIECFYCADCETADKKARRLRD